MSFHLTIDTARTAKRSRVFMSAVLTTPAGDHRVTVRDISSQGAQVGGAAGLSVCDALFRRGEVIAAARVAWVKGDEAGIHFYRELSAEEVAGALPGGLCAERRLSGVEVFTKGL